MPSPFTRYSVAGLGIAALALALAAPSLVRADSSPEEAPSLSDAVGDALGKITPLLNTKDWEGAEKLVDDLIPTVAKESFDLSFLYDTKARVLIQKGALDEAIYPMEQALQIADRHHFKNVRQTMEDVYLLSNLYYQEAGDSKRPKAQQLSDFAKAVTYIERWFTMNTRPNEEVSIYYSTLLYSEAVALNGEHPDPQLINKTQEEIRKALLIAVHPKETLYVLLLATYQHQGKLADAAEILEHVLQEHPNNKAYWPDLVGFYVNLAQASGKEDENFHKYYIRAINTVERAQALGFMKTPKDSFLLFTFYYDVGQFGTAADLLYAGLLSGSIESTVTNWQLLATSYQQINQDFKAIEVLKQAAEHFPADGQFYFQIAQVYTGMDKNEEAYMYEKKAVDTGGLEKAWIVYNTLAYSSYELGKYDEALTAIDQAITLKGGPADHQAASAFALRSTEAIKERNDRNTRQTAQ